MSSTNGDQSQGGTSALSTHRPPEHDGAVIASARAAARSLSFAAPLHPILVHYTIALTSASLLFDVLGRVLRQPGLSLTGWWTLALGVTATVLTLATGVASRMSLDIGEGTARSYLRLHMALGPMVFGLLVATAIWRGLLWRAEVSPGWWYLVLLAATSAVMAVQGYAGGELVYRWGAEVEGDLRGLRQRHTSTPPPRWPPAPTRASTHGTAP